MAEQSGDAGPFAVRLSAGSLRAGEGVVLEHTWTPDGVLSSPITNGGQALHLAVALCVLNDVYREGRELGIEVHGVIVEADGGFDAAWRSTGIEYEVVVASPAHGDDVDRLLERVDLVAEIPRAIRAGADVRRARP